MTTALRRRRSPDVPQIMRDAMDATGRNQVRLALDVLAVNDRTFRRWLEGDPCHAPIVRLAWLLAKHPKLADELESEFGY